VRALVIYESMFGNTEAIARAVAEGIAYHLEVEALEVASAPGTIPSDVVLLAVGGPTHAHGMTTPTTRADSRRRADRLVSGGEGVREWVGKVEASGPIAAAAFDTRIKGPALLWGSAARGLARELVRAGLRLALPPRSFLVEGPTGPLTDRLVEGELDRARVWGRELAASIRLPTSIG